MRQPDFLGVRSRGAKPRQRGLTHVLDKGLPAAHVAAVLESAGAYIDIWKFGWGVSYLDPDLEHKLAMLTRHDVDACLGGTLLEIAHAHGKAAQCLAWARDVGFPQVEVSRGTIRIPAAEKQQLIAQAAQSFTVLAEVGYKRQQDTLAPASWGEEAAADLRAGATMIVAEGRESGTVGIYRPDGTVREDIVGELVQRVDVAKVVFEAPRKDQQSWLICTFGRDVNLGNVPVAEVLALETLRLGLRSDTAHLLELADDADTSEPAR